MPVSASDEHRKRRATLSDQQVDLACLPRSVGLRPVSSPPRGAGQALLSMACHFHLTLRFLAFHQPLPDSGKHAEFLPGLESLG